MSSAPYTLFSGRCPHCHEGKLFAGIYTLHDACPSCGAVFMRDPGSWTGATVLGYMLGSVFAVVLLLLMFATGTLHDFSGLVVGLATCLFLLTVFRPVKAFWVGMLYDWGYVYPDAPRKPAEPKRAPTV